MFFRSTVDGQLQPKWSVNYVVRKAIQFLRVSNI